jgi:hypothetical protein
MAFRALRKLSRHLWNKKVILGPLVSARHCSSAAQAAPKIPHSPKKVCSVCVRFCICLVAEKMETSSLVGNSVFMFRSVEPFVSWKTKRKVI